MTHSKKKDKVRPMKFATTTLGCKVNQFETSALHTLLIERGHTQTTPDLADVLIINTCTVTGESSRKSRQAIRRMQEHNPDAILVVCGCFSQVSPEETAALGADIIFGSGDKRELAESIEKTYAHKNTVRCVDNPRERRVFEHLPAGPGVGRTRAMLKIEDGCDNFCSYCIIPYARGRVRSIPVAEAIEEAISLAAKGYHELVITGIEIASYGKDLEEDITLADLVLAISKAVPQMRLRLGSLEPNIITEEFCRTLSQTNLCRHFHISLQSGCNTTLTRMRRRYTTEKVLHAITLLRQYFPGAGITGDLIVGFPGETEEAHATTLEFLQECQFSSMHIFPYSPRPNTPAAEMDQQISKTEKTLRAKQAQAIAQEMELHYLEQCIGQTLPVLFETQEENFALGTADNYVTVRVEGSGTHGNVENVKITGRNGKELCGIIA